MSEYVYSEFLTENIFAGIETNKELKDAFIKHLVDLDQESDFERLADRLKLTVEKKEIKQLYRKKDKSLHFEQLVRQYTIWHMVLMKLNTEYFSDEAEFEKAIVEWWSKEEPNAS